MKTLHDIQEGELVGYYGFTKAFAVVVTKATAKTLTVALDIPQRFSRETGRKAGSAMERPFIKPIEDPA